jgi:hypothetical protein
MSPRQLTPRPRKAPPADPDREARLRAAASVGNRQFKSIGDLIGQARDACEAFLRSHRRGCACPFCGPPPDPDGFQLEGADYRREIDYTATALSRLHDFFWGEGYPIPDEDAAAAGPPAPASDVKGGGR